MKISIITATCNSESSIGDTLDSIAMQDCPRDRIEWVVIDSASTDRTLDIIKQSEFQPDRLLSEPDKGIYDALNKGVRMATGDAVGFLHSDDFFASADVLSRLAGIFNESEAEAVYGDLQYVRQASNGTFPVVRNWRSGAYSPRKLRWGWMPPHPALYVKKEVYERVALADGNFFDVSYRCAADYDFILRMFSKYDINPVYIEKVLVKMRLGGISNRSLRHIAQKSREDWQAIRQNRIGHLHTLAWKNISKLKQFFP
ncbi:MAG: glycosyltransferase family 2 protein [Verrucomicrobiota bacterium]